MFDKSFYPLMPTGDQGENRQAVSLANSAHWIFESHGSRGFRKQRTTMKTKSMRGFFIPEGIVPASLMMMHSTTQSTKWAGDL